MKDAAIYAKVSSEQQKEENTIASQTAALLEFAREQGYGVADEWVIEDEGFSGASLLRPGLERLRDLAAEGYIQAVLIHSPDRLSRASIPKRRGSSSLRLRGEQSIEDVPRRAFGASGVASGCARPPALSSED